MGLPMRKIHFESSPIGAGAIVGQQHTLACSCWGCGLGAAVPSSLDNKVQVLVLLAAAAAAGGLTWRPPCQPGAEAMAQPVRQRSGPAAVVGAHLAIAIDVLLFAVRARAVSSAVLALSAFAM